MGRPKIRGVANDLSQIPAIDWARLAAYIDGEGHISIQENIHRNGRRYQYIRVIVTNTDPRLISWLLARFGGGLMRGSQPLKANWRRAFKWSASCRHAEAILQHCYEYFITKRDQAEIALAFQATLQLYRRGNPLPAETQALRDRYRDQLSAARVVRHAEIKRDSHGNVTEFLH